MKKRSSLLTMSWEGYSDWRQTVATDDGRVNIHGKEYLTVALRVKNFREEHKQDYTLQSEIVADTDKRVVVRAYIRDLTKEGYPEVASGYAEESRSSSIINKTSALENCETSAYGRALAAFGLAGTEFASADELTNALNQQKSFKTTRKAPDIPSTPEQKVKIKTLLALEGITTDEMPQILEEKYKVPVGSVISLAKADDIIKDLSREKK